jgi:hypothetical protein
MAAVQRWVFYDPVELESWTMEINPNAGASPEYRKRVNQAVTTAPDGNVLLFIGGEEPQKLHFSGVSLTQSQHEAMLEWYQKNRVITITDDLDRVFNVLIVSYAPKRKLSHTNFWRQDYDVEALIVS